MTQIGHKTFGKSQLDFIKELSLALSADGVTQAQADAETELDKEADSIEDESTLEHAGSNELDDEGGTFRAKCEDDTSPKALYGSAWFSCDGTCQRSWSYADNFYSCRDCSAYLCPNFYRTLQVGTLYTKRCEKTHSHIYVPPFARKAWTLLPEQMMVVGETTMNVWDWVEDIRNEWGIEHPVAVARARASTSEGSTTSEPSRSIDEDEHVEGIVTCTSSVRSSSS